MTFSLYPYSADSREREYAAVYLAVISFGIIWVINVLLKHFGLTFPWWVDTPTTFGVYGILWKAMSSCAWKWPMLRALHVVQLPDLNGKWEGVFLSSYDGFQTDNWCRIEIEQSWTYIGVAFTTEQSASSSVIAGIQVNVVGGPRLTYEYLNVPRVDSSPGSSDIHEGTQWLQLSFEENGTWLRGHYYTSRRSGQTQGQIEVRRLVD